MELIGSISEKNLRSYDNKELFKRYETLFNLNYNPKSREKLYKKDLNEVASELEKLTRVVGERGFEFVSLVNKLLILPLIKNLREKEEYFLVVLAGKSRDELYDSLFNSVRIPKDISEKFGIYQATNRI